MNVDRIYTRNVIRIAKTATISEAARAMRQHSVGLLLVTGEGADEFQAVGTVTDRDIVIKALAEGARPETVRVGEVMTHRLDTVAATDDIHEALLTMQRQECRRLAVTDATGRIVGILSVDDLVDGIAADLSSLAKVMRAARGPEAAAPASKD